MLDKFYEDMIAEISNGASDREQLIIIARLVDNLRAWQLPCMKDTPEELYAINLAKIRTIIDETLNKEDEMNGKSNI